MATDANQQTKKYLGEGVEQGRAVTQDKKLFTLFADLEKQSAQIEEQLSHVMDQLKRIGPYNPEKIEPIVSKNSGVPKVDESFVSAMENEIYRHVQLTRRASLIIDHLNSLV